ncbi:ScbA/BarX family gamma-butyrolactone biosynthesis protein [Peterkaempfera bronchialis]|uniref:A-factor biosynthesis protein n=1 Tax=Peterkaempfera bronchialis TaxID=2126346 RepID=A0A345SRI8_9ACTN|nr:ScbA/BarX family gamma-butyrolactone biosynthesis protein [Peterkaempfera bronchialis]AXI76343.1 A-factor biosynthesis protein [Peterkaempfera bronchialis]
MHGWDGLCRPGSRRPRPLSWSRTVPRELVHRTSVAEVLLTDVRPQGPGRFLAAAQWPRSHPTFPHGGDDRHSPLMIAETLRQLGIYLPLRYYGVPPDAHLLITDLSFDLDPRAEPRAGHGATEVTCLIEVGGVRPAGGAGTPSGLRLRTRLLAGGRPFATAEGGARFLDAGQYTALRAARADRPTGPPGRTPPVRPEPGRLAVASPRDVVLALAGDQLLVDPADPRHPYYFDHDTDHVPGMALLEAARQAAALRSGGRLLRPTGCRLRALRITEFRPPAPLECTVHHRSCVFRVRQGGAPTAVGVLRYARTR